MVETESKRIIRIAIIGTGRIANRFVTDAALVNEVQITCVYNPHLNSAEAFAKKYGIKGTASSTESIMPLADAVYIATPHETHFNYAKMMLLAGKHVLCEKPMAFDPEEVKELYQIAKWKHCVLLEAIKTAYCPGFLALLKEAESGKIGKVCDVEAAFTRITPTNTREMTDFTFGGSFTELGSYAMLPVFKLFGCKYQKVSFYSIKAKNELDLYTKALFQYEDSIAQAKTGLGVKSEGQLLISGTKGYILAKSPWWMTKEFEIRYENPDEKEVFTFPYEQSGLQYELTEFVKQIYLQKTTDGNTKEEFVGVMEAESIAMAETMNQFLKQRTYKEYAKEKMKKVKIWAHRGCSMAYPENTLAAFAAAAKLPGITGIELDVQLTKDGVVVVFHDENVKRVTNGTENIVTYTLAQLKELDIKKKNDIAEDDFFQKIPTLDEVLCLLKPYCIQNGLLINIELKTGVVRYEGIEESTVSIVKKYGLERYIIYSSFLKESVVHIKELFPGAKTGMLADSLEECVKLAEVSKTDALHPSNRALNYTLPAHMSQMPVRVWNGEEPFYNDGRILREHNMRKYTFLGATDIITNVPELYL